MKLKKKADLASALLENLQRVRLFGHSLLRFFVGSVGRMIGRLFVNLVFLFLDRLTSPNNCYVSLNKRWN